MPSTTVSQLFTPVQLPTVVGVIFTVPSPSPAAVLNNGRVRFTNTTGAGIAVTAYADAAANPSAAANCCLNAYSVPANNYIELDVPTMKAGDTFRAFSASAGVTIHQTFGVLYTP
jgi:hypothetical protein